MNFFVIILMLNVHVQAGSIFGEFRDVMSSLENSFQKMITEVVTDVRDTIDCTVEAVEGALSLGSTISNPKCRGAIRQYQDKNGNRKGMSLNIRTDTSFHGIHYNDNYRKDIPKPNTYEEDKKYKFKNNDDRFENIKRFLKDEFEKMSASMRMQFKEIESEEKSASDAIIKYINILHNMKHNSKSDTEINEAKRILDGASKILNVNIKNGDTDDAKVNKILTTLEQGSQHEKVMQNTLSKIAENKFTNDRQNNSHLLPETFKEIFNKALSPSHVKDNTEERNHEIKDVKSSPFHGIDLSHHSIENVEPIDYDSLFGGGSHSESNNDALDDATKILEDSKRSSSILSNLFAQAAQAGSSIFDNPEPF